MTGSIVVPTAYEGITGIAHGGYTAGLLAAQVGGPLQVTLRRPPPLDTPLSVGDDGDGIVLRDPQGRRVMDAHAADEPTRALEPVALEESRARAPHPRFAAHPYPRCFVCGTEHEGGFAVRVSVPDAAGVATGVWVPSGPLLPEGERVPPAFTWAVVDCVTAWAFGDRWDDPEWFPAVTGQITVHAGAPVRRDEPHVLTARPAGRDGRRITVEATITDADGRTCARAEAVWVVVRDIPTPPEAA